MAWLRAQASDEDSRLAALDARLDAGKRNQRRDAARNWARVLRVPGNKSAMSLLRLREAVRAAARAAVAPVGGAPAAVLEPVAAADAAMGSRVEAPEEGAHVGRHLAEALLSEAVRAPTEAPDSRSQSLGDEELPGMPEAARVPVTTVAATWLNPGFPESTVCLGSNGTVAHNAGSPHGFVAVVGDGQLLLSFYQVGDSRVAVPHLLRPVCAACAPLIWRTYDRKEVLVLQVPFPDGFVPALVSDIEKHGLWFVPGRAPARADLAPGGAGTLAGAVAWWGLAHAQAASAAQQSLLVLPLTTEHGDEPVVLHLVSPGVWRCFARRCVLLEDGAPAPCLQPSDLPRFVPREHLKDSLL